MASTCVASTQLQSARAVGAQLGRAPRLRAIGMVGIAGIAAIGRPLTGLHPPPAPGSTMRRAGNAARLLKSAAVRQASTVRKAVSASALERELGRPPPPPPLPPIGRRAAHAAGHS